MNYVAVTAQMVKDLRALTGCGLIEAKKALTDANGDMNEAARRLGIYNGLLVDRDRATPSSGAT